MQESLTVEVALRRFTVWRGAVSLLALLAVASWLAWVMSRTSWPLVWQVAAGTGGAAAWLLVARSLLAMKPGVLACRGGRWTFAADAVLLKAADRTVHEVPMTATAAAIATDVEVAVALDFGSFLLLRLVTVDPTAQPRLRWLAAERHGVTDRWQALRCALYAPRPAVSAPGAPAAPVPE